MTFLHSFALVLLDSTEERKRLYASSSNAEIETLPVPEHTRLTLELERTHVRLMPLEQSIDEEHTPVLNLEFAQSGLRRIRVPACLSRSSSRQ